jgi:putative NADH-flavin reductase
MNIAIIGATGMVGSRITLEALRRAHRVIAVSRRPAAEPPLPGVTAHIGDACDRHGMIRLLATADAAIASIRCDPGETRLLERATETLLDAAHAAGVRLLVIGGAGPLRSPGNPDLLVLDDPRYVEPAWREAAVASTAQLRVCQRHTGAEWTYLSPPAVLEPGIRTGAYRRGRDTLLTRPDGSSHISAEDLAVAAVDELERPAGASHLTVGY